MNSHFVSKSCDGEYCRMCEEPASHKVGEELPWDDPMQNRHNLTAYLCCGHFYDIFGFKVPCFEDAT